jgi:hypothetical protein
LPGIPHHPNRASITGTLLITRESLTSQMHYLYNEVYCIFVELDHTDYLGKYSDILHGTDLIEAFQDGCIGKDNIVLMFSINSA